jgi:hypothetical protein
MGVFQQPDTVSKNRGFKEGGEKGNLNGGGVMQVLRISIQKTQKRHRSEEI